MPAVLPSGRLVVGMQLPIQSQSRIYVEPWEDGAGPAELARVARACDRAGFFYVAVCDHVAIPAEKADAMGTEWWDTLTTLGWLAGVTEQVHLLSHVYVLPYRHPLVAAKGFATLDAISGGRAILGVGAGHVEGEFESLGVPFAERGRLLDDGLDAVRAAFADGDQRPRPARAGGPPIWVGGSSKPALRRAAEKGDGWLPQGPPPDGMRAAIAWLRERREQLGLDPDAFDLGVNTEPVHLGDPTWDVGEHTLTGSSDHVAERLRRYGKLGVGQLQVRFRSRSADELVEQVERFGAEVVPHLDD